MHQQQKSPEEAERFFLRMMELQWWLDGRAERAPGRTRKRAA